MSTGRFSFLRPRRSCLLAGISGLLCAALGILVLVGWHIGSMPLVRVGPDFVPMHYLSGLCFLVSGLGLAAFALRLPRIWPILCGALAGGIGLLISVEYALDCDFGFAALVSCFPELPNLAPRRSSPPTAVGFALAGAGIFLLRLTLPRTLRRLGLWMVGSSLLALCLMALCSHMLGITVMFVSGASMGMAPHTAAGLSVLSIGLLSTQRMKLQRLLDDPWLPVPVGLGTMAAALMLWQGLVSDRTQSLQKEAALISKTMAEDSRDRLNTSQRALELMGLRWERRNGTPWPEWREEARETLKDGTMLKAVGRTGPSWKAEWLEPADAGGLAWVSSLDLHQEPRWEGAEAELQPSLINRGVVVSPTMELNPGTRGFLVCLPLFSSGKFDGFLFGVFDLSALIATESALARTRISLYEGSEHISSPLPAADARKDPEASESKIDFHGHQWRLMVEPEESTATGGRLPSVILGLGLLLSGAMAAAVRGFQQDRGRNRTAQAAHEKLRREVIERESAERQLRASEERFGVVLESATGVAVITTDPTGLITYFSKGAERLLGYTAEEMTGKATPAILHDPDQVKKRAVELTAELGRSVEGFDVFTLIPRLRGSERREWSFIRKDGSRLTVDLSISVLDGGAQGSPAGFLGTAVDITERKQMERNLRATIRAKNASQALLESASRIARLGHWELMLDGSNPRWSDVLYEIHELPPGTPITLDRALDFYHPDDRPRIQERVEQSLKTGQVYEFEARLITAKGREIWAHLRGEPVRDEQGAVTGFHGVLQDVDERHRASELLKEQNRQLEAAKALAEAHARAKAEFLANMSHEIRTPLNAIIGMSELLIGGQLDAREREFVDTIHTSGDVLLSLINDILDFSKIESGQLDLERIPVHLRDCVESVLDLLAGQAAKKKLDLMYWIDSGVPEAIVSDPTRLRQVLVNLTSNAIKFTDKGEIFLKLSVRQGKNGPMLHAAVRDSGIGIPAGRMDRLFSAFSQVDASTTRRFGGTGLGLAICRRLIENMAGRIWAESEEGKGSVFQFEIPLQSAQAPASAGTLETGVAIRSLEGLSILIVDDNATNRWILEMQINSWSMRSTSVEGAGQALGLITSGGKFDLAIIDVMMPEMDGYELVAEIRRLRSQRELPILMLTSLGEVNRDSRQLGISAVLSKPVKNSPLFNTVSQILTAAATAPKGAPAASGVDGNAGVLRPLRILVAEDNPVNQRVVALHLQRMGYRAVMAGNGLEVLDALRRTPYDVILLDVQMPEMDGLEAAREICHRYPPGSRPWMIALTANALGGDEEECLAAGMNDYLSKPVRGGSLQTALQRAYEERNGAGGERTAPEAAGS
ncbi:MAG: response regulator [Verrucomicrobiaceae bacterium]|nr:MAG: response regulator [Verrucomicrobiaceae bacterium]